MSWWDTSGITNLASQALKNAQKKIDKVLDIEDNATAKNKGSEPSNKRTATKNADEAKEVSQEGEFWSAWLGSGSKKTNTQDSTEKTPSSSPSYNSSWSNPFSNASNTSGLNEGTTSSISTSHSDKKLKRGFQKPGADITSSDVGQQSSLHFTEASTKFSTAEDNSEHSSDKFNVFLDKSANIEQTQVLSSESFASEWQDFPMEGDPEPEDNSISEIISKVESPSVQNISDKIDLIPSAINEMQPFVDKANDKELTDNVANVETKTDSVDYKHRSYQDDLEFKNVDVERNAGNYSEPTDNLLPDAVLTLSSSLAIDSDSGNLPMQVLYRDKEHIQESNTISDKNVSLDDIAKLDISHDDNFSKTSSSSSFFAVLEESPTEIVPSRFSSVPYSDIHSEAVSSSEHIKSEEIEIENTPADISEHILHFTAQKHSDEGSVVTSSDTSHHQENTTADYTRDSSALVTQETEHLLDITGTVLPELTMNSDYQRHQSDFMQEYVNISSVGDSNQTVSFDDIHTSNELEMGNSRTSSDLDLPGGGRASSTGSSDTSKFDSSIDTVVDRSVLDSQSDVDLMDRDPPYSLFDDNQAGGIEIVSNGRNQSDQLVDNSQSLSSSYVKCMIEEAMEDFSKTEDSGSDNHSNGEKSESSKVDSELEKSVYSGHESSDEIETTTSSDIEIISAPTPNGDNKYHIPFDLSPLKISFQRSGRDQGHNRSDSQSSSSAHSKAGEMDRMSPERGEGSSWRDDDLHHHDLHAVREESAENPFHPERLLKKLAEMAEVLQARENKLVQLSKENHQLTEDNNILRNQLQQAEEAREMESADLTGLTEEFAVRIGDAEKKIQAAIKEKEVLRQKLTMAERELERRSANSDLESLLEEKKLQVEELMAEGEKLSKKELQNGIIIKKLRTKEKEFESTMATQKKKLEEQTKELERLTTVLDSKEEMEKKQTDAINQLNAAVQRQEKELIKYKSDLEDAQEKCRGLQAALDNSYKEIAELHRSNASQDSKAQEAALSAETHVREELKATMEREQQRFRQEREAFIMQIDDLRLDMARLEKEHSRREDLLRQEITHLQERQQQDEARSQDLTQSVSSATRPLLRQIENLQATFGAQSSAWERVEKNLIDRLAEAQTALAMAQEKERTANDHLMELSARVASLEAANSRIKQERVQLAAQVESDRSRLEELQDIRNSVVAELESSKQKLTQELSQLKMDKVYLESQLNVERTRLENERKKAVSLEEQLRLAERPRSRGTPSPSPSMSVSRQESLAGSMYEHPSPGNNMSWSFHDENESVSTFAANKTSVYDSLRQSGAAVVFESLSSQLKLREGEITHMQSEISQLERTRESMARELVNLTNQNDELLEIKKANEQLQEQFNELNQRYGAILQMYGEKEEQVQELRLDLQDVKEMYKSQIDALLAK